VAGVQEQLAVPEARFPVVQSTLLLESLNATVPVAPAVTLAVKVTAEPYVGVVLEAEYVVVEFDEYKSEKVFEAKSEFALTNPPSAALVPNSMT
jgi:hypothetical protein